MPKSIEFNFLVRVVQLLGVHADSAQSLSGCGLSTDPTPQDLEKTLASYFNRKRHEVDKDLLPPKVAVYQECLELVLQYDVYQVLA